MPTGVPAGQRVTRTFPRRGVKNFESASIRVTFRYGRFEDASGDASDGRQKSASAGRDEFEPRCDGRAAVREDDGVAVAVDEVDSFEFREDEVV